MRVIERIRSLNLSAVCFTLSAIGLGRSLQVANGFYDPNALLWLTCSFALAIVGTFVERLNERATGIGARLITVLLVIGIAWQLQQLLTAKPGLYLARSGNMGLFTGGIIVQAVAVAGGLLHARVIKPLWFPTFLLVSLGLGIWMIKASPEPYIDVVVVHKEAIEALLSNRDPYRISFANIYELEDAQKFYNPDTVVGNRLAFAYPYPPASLLLAVPGHLLFGDYRYAELAALIAGAALIGFVHRGLISKLAACLLLTTPRVWFIIEQGWTEPIAVFVLALTVFLMTRNSVAAGWAAGLFLVTKQYLGFAGLAVIRFIFMRPRVWMWTTVGVVLAAAVITLPLALWHPNAFMRNVVWHQTLEPLRIDSLSYLSWAARNGWGQGSFLWALGAGVTAAVVSLLTTRNTPEAFAASVAMTMFVMFAFGSKAFCNYYFFVIGALCCAIAALPPFEESDRAT